MRLCDHRVNGEIQISELAPFSELISELTPFIFFANSGSTSDISGCQVQAKCSAIVIVIIIISPLLDLVPV